MSTQDLTEMIMNPIRLRIVQFLMLHESGTTAEMKLELTDVPQASLYRHIKILEKANLIIVIQETKIRGTVEKTYQLNKDMNQMQTDNNQILHLINSGLLTLMSDFTRYFSQGERDPQKDMLFLSTSALLLSDEEFMIFTQKIGEVYNEVINNKPNEERKVRRITLVSSPSESIGESIGESKTEK